MPKFIIKTYKDECVSEIKGAANIALIEVCGELETQVKRNTRVDFGQTKKNWSYYVDEKNLVGYVGNTDENAIREEFGTGVHATDGKGRKTPWYVPVDTYTGTKKPTFNGKVTIVYGKNGKHYYKTDGKKGIHTFQKAFDSTKNKIVRCFKGVFSNL